MSDEPKGAMAGGEVQTVGACATIQTRIGPASIQIYLTVITLRKKSHSLHIYGGI